MFWCPDTYPLQGKRTNTPSTVMFLKVLRIIQFNNDNCHLRYDMK